MKKVIFIMVGAFIAMAAKSQDTLKMPTKDGKIYYEQIIELGKYYFDKKMHFKARAHLRKAVAAVEHMNGLLIQVDCYEYLGDVYAAIDNKQKSLKYYQICKSICENSDAIWFKQRSQELKVKIEKL